MPLTTELFRFVTVRRANRALLHRIEGRLIRDRRKSPSLLVDLFGPGEFEDKLTVATDFAAGPNFVRPDDAVIRALEPIAEFLRGRLSGGIELRGLSSDFAGEFPVLARLLAKAPPADLLERVNAEKNSLWDSLYAQTTRGCDRYVSTNYLVDALRVYHVLLLVWLSLALNRERWAGGTFDEYHPIIDLEKAAAGGGTKPGDRRTPQPGPMEATAGSQGGSAVFRVPLDRGAMKPPVVGDLLRVEQDLRRYELSEIADLVTVMQGERRERTVRTLARTTQTTTTETASEREQTSSVTTDERFQLAAQSQSTASQAASVDVGVSASGKWGPVQVSATASASFDTSKSSTDSQSQEYAKNITETASSTVRNSFKQSTSFTVLNERQETSLQGFNNEAGTGHVNGIYRWLDKVYEARLMNYGRRFMLSFTTPEPAVYYRALLAQGESAALEALVEPTHPVRLHRTSMRPLEPDEQGQGFRSFEDVSEGNYAQLAAFYDIGDVEPPPVESLTGSKSIVVPEGAPPTELKDNGLALVMKDDSLVLPADYRLTGAGVYVPDGPSNNFRQFVDTLHLGEKKNEVDRILVGVGDRDFHLTVTGNGNDPATIDTNFNTTIPFHPSAPFASLAHPSLPVTVSATFSGMLALTIVYTAVRTAEAFQRWQASVFAAALKAYAAQKQAFDQAVAAARALGTGSTVAQTHNLREDQYRAIELTELKRACIELMTAGTADGHPSIRVGPDGKPTVVHEEADAAGLPNWRSPVANGAVVDLFELGFDWGQATYQFHPYYWAGPKRWDETALAAGADPVFEAFLRAGSASVVVPVHPGYERPVVFFLKTGRVWGGGYLPLFTHPDMLDVYTDAELGTQFDPPLQVGEPWEVRLPTSYVMLQAGDTLPEFPPEAADEPVVAPTEPAPDDSAPF